MDNELTFLVNKPNLALRAKVNRPKVVRLKVNRPKVKAFSLQPKYLIKSGKAKEK